MIDTSTAAFMAVDIQNDFCPKGALAVPDGDAVVPIINRLAGVFHTCVLTQDWHPVGHVSFASSHPGTRPYDAALVNGRDATLWPDHCVQASTGADFNRALDQRPYRLIVRKGQRPGLDSYSAFFENDGLTTTGLDGFLRGLGLDTVYLAGLALDYCVLFSALDAARLGYRVVVLRDATRAVDSPAGRAAWAIAELQRNGVSIMESTEVLS